MATHRLFVSLRWPTLLLPQPCRKLFGFRDRPLDHLPLQAEHRCCLAAVRERLVSKLKLRKVL